MKTIDQEITEWCFEKWGTKDIAGIALKLAEEAGEVAGAAVKIPEGRATVKDLLAEAGDCLIVLSQLAALNGTTLAKLRERRFVDIKARAGKKEEERAPLPLSVRVTNKSCGSVEVQAYNACGTLIENGLGSCASVAVKDLKLKLDQRNVRYTLPSF